MEFIKNQFERREEFYRLWNEEVKLNTEYYKFMYGNDILFLKGISKAEIIEVLNFCDKYHKKFKYFYIPNDNKITADEMFESINNNGMLLLKHLFDYD